MILRSRTSQTSAALAEARAAANGKEGGADGIRCWAGYCWGGSWGQKTLGDGDGEEAVCGCWGGRFRGDDCEGEGDGDAVRGGAENATWNCGVCEVVGANRAGGREWGWYSLPLV